MRLHCKQVLREVKHQLASQHRSLRGELRQAKRAMQRPDLSTLGTDLSRLTQLQMRVSTLPQLRSEIRAFRKQLRRACSVKELVAGLRRLELLLKTRTCVSQGTAQGAIEAVRQLIHYCNNYREQSGQRSEEANAGTSAVRGSVPAVHTPFQPYPEPPPSYEEAMRMGTGMGGSGQPPAKQ